VIRDRAALAREIEGGEIENVYRLQIMNTTEQPRVYEVDVKGLMEIHIDGEHRFEVGGASGRTVPLRIRVHAEREHLRPGTHPIEFMVSAVGFPDETVHEKSVFIVR
jgi:polyferredoxin